MCPAAETLDVQLTVQEAARKVQASTFRAWPVNNQSGVAGMVSLSTLQKALADGGANRTLGEFVDARDFPHLHADHPLSLALERMGATHLEVLPVVSRADVHKLEGIVTLQDVLNLYGFGCSVGPA
jgi:CIC family chloride channel protein